MNTLRLVFISSFLILILVLVFPIFAQFTPIPICTESHSQWYPDISGDRIVWQDSRNGFQDDIYMYDLSNGTETPIATESHDQKKPAIHGDYIVWEDYRNGFYSDIFMYDISTGNETSICTAVDHQKNPDISGNIVVWEDYRHDNWDIYMYDISTGIETQITFDSTDQKNPAISGNRIVWEDHGFMWNIHLYDLVSDTIIYITAHPDIQKNPAICGDYIVWEDLRGNASEIYMYNLTDSTEMRITNDAFRQELPVVSNDLIVWTDSRDPFNGDISLYEIASGAEIPLITESHRQRNVAVSGNQIVWQDLRNGNDDIYCLPYVRPAGADLCVNMQDHPDPVEEGYYLTYSISVKNYGPDNATGVVVTDTLPANINFLSVTSTRGVCNVSNEVVTCNIAELDSGENVIVTIIVQPLIEGLISNSVSINGNEIDSLVFNNSLIEETFVSPVTNTEIGDGWYPNMVLDSLGNAHISYTRSGFGGVWKPAPGNYHFFGYDDIMYATNASGSWVKETVYLGTGFTGPAIPSTHSYYEGKHSTLDIDKAGNVHVCYVVDENHSIAGRGIQNASKILKYKKKISGIWQLSEILGEYPYVIDYGSISPTCGCWPLHIKIDSEDHTHIVFSTSESFAGTGTINYLTNASGQWVTTAIDGARDDVSFALDSNNHIHLSYYLSGANAGIYYTTNAPDGVWQTRELVDTEFPFQPCEGKHTDISVDAANRPHISYIWGHYYDNRYAMRDSSGVWHVTTLDDTLLNNVDGAGNAIAVDADTNVHTSYYNLARQELRYASNSSGSWYNITVDEGPYGWDYNRWFNDIAVDTAGNVNICYEKDRELRHVVKRVETDGDKDGIVDSEEMGSDSNDPNYDGNGDGIPDSQQDNVASFHSFDYQNYVTLACDDTNILANVHPQDNPAPNDPGSPSSGQCPYQYFSFTIMGLNAGDTVTVNLYLHSGPLVDTYYKYGATPDTTTNHWYEFIYDGYTGAEINGNVITLHFIDGQRGDNDITANGIIEEPGGPGIPPSSISSKTNPVPKKFELYQNYPNPFNPITHIKYDLPKSSKVKIDIFNILGQKVITLVDDYKKAGPYVVDFDGSQFASGLYFYRIETKEFSKVHKMILMK
jgi:TolB protein